MGALYKQVKGWLFGFNHPADIPTDALIKKIDVALSNLGETVEEVAGYLHQHKMTGARRDVCLCPIATYLKQLLPIVPNYTSILIISGNTYCLNYHKHPEFVLVARGSLPEPVQKFIREFDAEYKHANLLAAMG